MKEIIQELISAGRKALASLIIVLLLGTLIPYIMLLFCWMVVSFLFPESWFHTFEDCLWGWFQRFTVFFFEHSTGVEVFVDGPIPEITENCLVVCNHQCTLDWVVANFITVRQKVAGHMRYVFKNALKYYPLCGLGFAVHGGVFVRRDGHYNDNKTKQVLQKLKRRKATIYFMIYPEGTRFRPGRKDILKKSQDFAAKMNLKQLQQVLTPRVKAFDTALSSLQDYIGAVYDMTVIYDPMQKHEHGERAEPPTVLDFLRGRCKRVYVSYKRLPIDDVISSINQYKEQCVDDVSGSMRWLHERFVLKDELFHTFYEDDSKEQSSDGHSCIETETVSWRKSHLSLFETLPSALLAIFIHAIFLYFPLGRLIYLATIVTACTIGILYCHFLF